MENKSLTEEKKIGRFICRLFKDDPQCDGSSWISFSHRSEGGCTTRLFTNTYPKYEEALAAYHVACQTTYDTIACITQEIREVLGQ